METNKETNKTEIETQKLNLENLSPEAQEIIKEAQKEIDEGFERLTQATEASAKNPEDFKKVSLIENMRILVNTKMLTALLAISSFSGMKAAETNTNFSHEDKTKTEKSISTSIDTDAKIIFGEDFDKGKKPKKEKKVFNFETEFEFAKANLSEEAQNLLDKESEKFVMSLTHETIEKIKNHQGVIVIEAATDPVRVIKVGTATNNYELAQLRAKTIKKSIIEELKKSNINNPTIIVTIPQIDGLEKGVSQDGKRYGRIHFEDMNNTESLVSIADYLILDKTGSMKDDVDAVKKIIEQKTKSTQVIPLESGYHTRRDQAEYILSTLDKTIKEATEGSIILIKSDEIFNYAIMTGLSEKERADATLRFSKKLEKLAKEKNIQVLFNLTDIENPDDQITFPLFEQTKNLVETKKNSDHNAFKTIKINLEK